MAACVTKFGRNILSKWNCVRSPQLACSFNILYCKQSTNASHETKEEEDVDLYPPIKPPYPPGKWGDIDRTRAWKLNEMAEELRAIPNAKERLEKMAGTANVKERSEKMAGTDNTPMNKLMSRDLYPATLHFKQFVTKTHIINGLPEVYNSLNVDKFLKASESNIEDAFMEEHAFMKQQSESAKKTYNECTQTHNIIGRIVNKLAVFLSASYDHLLYSQFDENIRMECFWRRTGFNFYPPRNPLHGTLFFQHISDVDWHIRTELPLPKFIDPQDSTCQTGFYPDMTDKHPKYFGAPLIQAKPTSVSGHWIGDPCEFSSLVIVCPEHSLHTYFVDMYGAEAARQQSTSTITTAAFAACVAQAHNQGFNWLMDITYPFTTQAVYCDGSTVQFCAYQLNTLEMWKNNEAVPTRNIAWITEGQQLYEAIEEGMVKGLNKEVVSQLVKMLVLEPMEPTYDLRPYLPDDPSPRLTHKYINKVGEPPIERPKIERWQYPENAVYF